MVDQVLNRPTVAELIAKLSEYPPDAKLTIEDADTNQTIVIIHIAHFDGEVSLSGRYDEME